MVLLGLFLTEKILRLVGSDSVHTFDVFYICTHEYSIHCFSICYTSLANVAELLHSPKGIVWKCKTQHPSNRTNPEECTDLYILNSLNKGLLSNTLYFRWVITNPQICHSSLWMSNIKCHCYTGVSNLQNYKQIV